MVAAGILEPAVGAGAFDIAVGQEPPVGLGIDLALFHFLDQALIIKRCGKVLGQRLVLRTGGPAKVIEGQAEAFRDAGLNLVHLGAVFRHRFTCFGSSQFSGRTMFIRRAEKQHLLAAPALIAGV